MSRPTTRNERPRPASASSEGGRTAGNRRKGPLRRNKQKKSDLLEAKVPLVNPESGSDVRKLRALGHSLEPVLVVGKEGITDAVVAACSAVLLTHELVKVKILAEAPADRKDAAADLATKTNSLLAQVLGRTCLLYKRHPNKPKVRI